MNRGGRSPRQRGAGQMETTIAVARLDASTLAEYWVLMSEEPHADWCYCSAWWVPSWDGWDERTAEENRSVVEARLAAGDHEGYIVRAGGLAVGWMQVIERDRAPKLVRQLELAPDPGVRAITCLRVAPRMRRRGVASLALTAILAELDAAGVPAVEAYPRAGDPLPEDETWNGTESLFSALGFHCLRPAGEGHPRSIWRRERAGGRPGALRTADSGRLG